MRSIISWSSMQAITLPVPPQRPHIPPPATLLNNPTPDLPRFRQLRITDTMHHIARRRILIPYHEYSSSRSLTWSHKPHRAHTQYPQSAQLRQSMESILPDSRNALRRYSLGLLASRVPNLLAAALRLVAADRCFLMALSWPASLVCIMLDTVRMPRAVPTRPDRAALKAVLVSVSMLVANSARSVRVIISRLSR